MFAWSWAMILALLMLVSASTLVIVSARRCRNVDWALALAISSGRPWASAFATDASAWATMIAALFCRMISSLVALRSPFERAAFASIAEICSMALPLE